MQPQLRLEEQIPGMFVGPLWWCHLKMLLELSRYTYITKLFCILLCNSVIILNTLYCTKLGMTVRKGSSIFHILVHVELNLLKTSFSFALHYFMYPPTCKVEWIYSIWKKDIYIYTHNLLELVFSHTHMLS